MITGAVSVQAHQLRRYLNTTDEVIFADSKDVPFGMNTQSFIKIPPGDSPAFAHTLLSACLDLEIGKVYPLRTSELTALAEAKTLFEEYGIHLIVPQKEKIPDLLNKGINGKIFVEENAAGSTAPDSGVFIISESQQIQLFTAD